MRPLASTDDLRASGHALLRLAEYLDRNAPGLLPDNEDAIFAIPSLILRTEDAAMCLSYQAALRDAMAGPYTFYPEPGRSITANAPGSPLHVFIQGPAPERITEP